MNDTVCIEISGRIDLTNAAEGLSIGGLGIFIKEKTMDDVTYEYKNGTF